MSDHTAFANRLRMYLQVISADRHEYGQPKGRLVQRDLHKIVVNKPGYSDRVFKKVRKNKTLDIAVQLVCDLSGSMGGEKWQITQQAMRLVNEAIGNVLGIPLEISTFATEKRGPEEHGLVYVLRDFGQSKLGTDKLEVYMKEAARNSFSNNQDGEAVAEAYHRMLTRKEPRRIMIVMSDGQPACYRRGDFRGYLKSVVAAIEKERKVEIYGFGICSDAVDKFYTKRIVCNNADEIDVRLLTLLSQVISNT